MAATSDELVKDLIKRMQNSSAGDASAAEELRRHSSPEGAATETAVPPVVEKQLRTEQTEIIRPNGEVYHVRKLGQHHDVEVLRKARAKNIFPLLTGPPGTGKTALLEAAYCTDSTVYTVQGSGDTEWADFVGGWVQRVITNEDGSTYTKYEWVHGPLPLAMESGGVLYVDEIPLIDPKVLAGLYGQMDGRGALRITQNPDHPVIHPKPGFFVCAAANPNAPGARMSEALLSRFRLQFEVTTDYTLAKKLGVEKDMITAAQNMQTKVDTGAGLDWAPQLRELLAYQEISKEFGQDIALRNVVMNAPEMSRSIVAEIISRQYGKQIKGLKLT